MPPVKAASTEANFNATGATPYFDCGGVVVFAWMRERRCNLQRRLPTLFVVVAADLHSRGGRTAEMAALERAIEGCGQAGGFEWWRTIGVVGISVDEVMARVITSVAGELLGVGVVGRVDFMLVPRQEVS